MEPTTVQELIGVMGIPGAIFFMTLTIAAGLWIRKTTQNGGSGANGSVTRTIGRLEGVLDGLARSQEQLADALRDLIREHTASRLTVEKVANAIEGFAAASSDYQRHGGEAFRKVGELHEELLKARHRSRR